MAKYLMTFFVVLFSVSPMVQGEESEKTEQDTAKVVLDDPTEPLGYAKKATVQKKAYRPRLPTLQSVLLDKNKKRAIMNNKFYEVGQTVNGYRISRIDKGAVSLVYGAKTYRVSLYSNSEKFSQ